MSVLSMLPIGRRCGAFASVTALLLGALPVVAQEQVASHEVGRQEVFRAQVKDALKANRGALFTNPDAALEDRVEDLLARLSLEEKAALIHGSSGFEFGQIPRLSIPSIGMSDGPQGVRGPVSTKFPSAIAMASTWDTALVYELGEALAAETLAAGSRVLLGPSIDIVRTPLAGRNFENFSEDPWLTSELAVAYIRGLQEHGVAACVKHFTGNHQERWRRRIDAQIPERALREIYTPGFEAAVREGGVWSIMGAYNQVNGEWACYHDVLLNQILKDEWGFDGAVISDWGAWRNTVKAVNGGCTIEMTAPADPQSPAKTLALLESGKIDRARFEDSVRRNVRFLIRSGVFNPDLEGQANTPEHQELARRVAEASVVLLKNEGQTLPLNAESIRTLAVIGPAADWKLSRTNARDSGGSGAVFPPYEVTPLQGLRDKLGDSVQIRFVEGFSYADDAIAETLTVEARAAAVEAARNSDAVIFFGGTNHSYDREGTSNVRPEDADKQDLGLIGPQGELIRAVAEVNPRTVVVLVNGSPVAVGDWIDAVPALLEAWYPGMEGGTAIANILFGDVNPSGKLPVTFGRRLEDWKVHALGEENYPGTGRGGHVRYDDGIWVGYRWFDHAAIEPQFPFGFGLSYTSFAVDDLQVEETANGWEIRFSIENTGKRPGAEVVQLYVEPPANALVERPVRELKGFAKVNLQPAQKRTLTLNLDRAALRYWSEEEGDWAIDKGEYILRIGNSSRNLPLSQSIRVR